MSFTWAYDKMPDFKWDTSVLAYDDATGKLLTEMQTMDRWFEEFQGKIVRQPPLRYSHLRYWGSVNPSITHVQRELIKFDTDVNIHLENQYVRAGVYNIGRGRIDDREEDLSDDEEEELRSTMVKQEVSEVEPAMSNSRELVVNTSNSPSILNSLNTTIDLPFQSIPIMHISSHNPNEYRNVEEKELLLHASNAFDCALQKFLWPHRFTLQFNMVPLRAIWFSLDNTRFNIQNKIILTIYENACEPHMYEHIYMDGTMWTPFHQWRVNKCHLRYMYRLKLKERIEARRSRMLWSERDIRDILDSY